MKDVAQCQAYVTDLTQHCVMVVLTPRAHEAAQMLMGQDDGDDVTAHRQLPGFSDETLRLRHQASAFKP